MHVQTQCSQQAQTDGAPTHPERLGAWSALSNPASGVYFASLKVLLVFHTWLHVTVSSFMASGLRLGHKGCPRHLEFVLVFNEPLGFQTATPPPSTVYQKLHLPHWSEMPAASYTRCLSGSTSGLALQSRYPRITRQGSVALLTGALCHEFTPLRTVPMFLFCQFASLTEKNIYHLLKLTEYLAFLSLMALNRETLEEDPLGWCLFLSSSHIVKASVK